MQEQKRPIYEVPTVRTYTDEEILNDLGQIHTYCCITGTLPGGTWKN